MQPTHRRSYHNPLANEKSANVLDAIEESSEEAEKMENNYPDPFNQRVDSTTFNRSFFESKHFQAPSFNGHPSFHYQHQMVQMPPEEEAARSSWNPKEYLHRMKDVIKGAISDANKSKKEDENKGEKKKNPKGRPIRDCLQMTNQIVGLLLMLLTILLIVVTSGVLVSMLEPAKELMSRASNILGEQAIVLNNVTIKKTKIDHIKLPPIGDLFSTIPPASPLSTLPTLPLPKLPELPTLPSLTKPSGALIMSDPLHVKANAIELKDAKVDPFTEWCQDAECTADLKGQCSTLGKAVNKGQKHGVPVIPFPREFCSAIKKLNDANCMCDKNIMNVPGAERLVQSATLVAMMCGFKDELKTCPKDEAFPTFP